MHRFSTVYRLRRARPYVLGAAGLLACIAALGAAHPKDPGDPRSGLTITANGIYPPGAAVAFAGPL